MTEIVIGNVKSISGSSFHVLGLKNYGGDHVVSLQYDKLQYNYGLRQFIGSFDLKSLEFATPELEARFLSTWSFITKHEFPKVED